MAMTILAIAPHPDDESIGCGGALHLHASRGDRVVVVFLTSGELGLKQLPPAEAWRIRELEARQATKILGLADLVFLRRPDWLVGDDIKGAAQALRPVLTREVPELIYLPHPADWHPDHKAALPVVRAALKGAGVPIPILRGYEVWTPLSEHDHVENITAVMPRKLRALRAHKSQLDGKFDYERAVTALNQFRGALAGRCKFAEAFQTLS
jgi:LmbE family N-acetylglucosaminyl deacetylase